jgi:RecJ-like exonuclease
LSPGGIKMTGHKRNRKQKPLFQNMKMFVRLQNWIKKSLNSERDIADDILEIVNEMKRTANLLEEIAKQLKAKLVRDTNDVERLIEED